MTFGRTGPTIADLVNAGLVKAGDEWRHPRAGKKPPVVAVVSEEGGLRIGERGYDNPSRAAKAVSGTEINGWTFWRFERDGQWLAIDELRTQFERRRPRKRARQT